MDNIYKKKNSSKSKIKIVNVILIAVIVLLLILGGSKLTAFAGSVWTIFTKYIAYFRKGLLITVILSLISVIGGSVLGTFLYFLRISKYKVLSYFSKAYVEIIRGTPLLTQVMIASVGTGLLLNARSKGISISTLAFISGTFAVMLNSGAYISEIIRAGIEAIDKGQFEAAASLGMSPNLTMKEIILPQAVKNILPALCNEFIAIIKETSIVSSIGVTDIMFNVNVVRGSAYKALEPLIIAAILYFILTFTLSKAVKVLERKLKND